MTLTLTLDATWLQMTALWTWCYLNGYALGWVLDPNGLVRRDIIGTVYVTMAANSAWEVGLAAERELRK